MHRTDHDIRAARKEALDALDDLLRAEVAACDCYQAAGEKLSDDPVPDLFDVQRSHRARAEALRGRIIALGGEPSTGAGVKGAWAGLLVRGAQLFGRASTLSALEECEDRCLAEYRDELEHLDADTRAFVEQEVLPEQSRTHAIMQRVKERCC